MGVEHGDVTYTHQYRWKSNIAI